MKNLVFYILLVSLLTATLIGPSSCSFGSRRRTKTKEKTETKEEKSEGEEENKEIDLNNIPPNATFKCVLCQGKYCSTSFLKFKIQHKIIECQAGDVCWQSQTKDGWFRGCGSRECIQNQELNNFEIGNSTESELFANNFCCGSDLCNSGIRFRFNYFIALTASILFMSMV